MSWLWFGLALVLGLAGWGMTSNFIDAYKARTTALTIIGKRILGDAVASDEDVASAVGAAALRFARRKSDGTKR